MGRKRKRETAKKVRQHNPEEENAAVSRLKKGRLITDEKPKDKDEAVDEDEEETERRNLRIAKLKEGIDGYLQRSGASKLSIVPDVDLLTSIQEVLETVPIPTIVLKLAKIPRVLLIAAQKGIDERGKPVGSGSVALARCLGILAKGVNVVVPEDSGNVKTRRSAFHTKQGEQFTTIELEAVSKAGKWATQVLTDCVRGEDDGGDGNRGEQGEQMYALKHHDISATFVSPRDKLDVVMSRQYVSSIIARINECVASSEATSLHKISVLRVLCGRMDSEVHQASFLPIVEAVILGASRIEATVEKVGSRDLSEPLPSHFVDRLINEQDHSLFLEVCIEARAALLSLSRTAWSRWLLVAQNIFSTIAYVSLKDQRRAVQALGMAAAENVDLHWILMDEVRREISNSIEPFSICLWRKRHFFRAVLSETNDEIEKRNAGFGQKRNLRSCSPMFRRVPERFRSLVRTISTFSSCARKASKMRNFDAGLAGVTSIIDELELRDSVRFSPNAHAVLLCCERQVEILCWATGHVLASRVVQDEAAFAQGKVALSDVALVSALLEMIRLPGGASAESEAVIRSRASALEDALMSTCRRQKLPSRRSSEWRLSGVIAMAICGLWSGCDTRGLKKFCELLDISERKELLRAAECSIELVDDGSPMERALNLEKELSRLAFDDTDSVSP